MLLGKKFGLLDLRNGSVAIPGAANFEERIIQSYGGVKTERGFYVPDRPYLLSLFCSRSVEELSCKFCDLSNTSLKHSAFAVIFGNSVAHNIIGLPPSMNPVKPVHMLTTRKVLSYFYSIWRRMPKPEPLLKYLHVKYYTPAAIMANSSETEHLVLPYMTLGEIQAPESFLVKLFGFFIEKHLYESKGSDIRDYMIYDHILATDVTCKLGFLVTKTGHIILPAWNWLPTIALDYVDITKLEGEPIESRKMIGKKFLAGSRRVIGHSVSSRYIHIAYISEKNYPRTGHETIARAVRPEKRELVIKFNKDENTGVSEISVSDLPISSY